MSNRYRIAIMIVLMLGFIFCRDVAAEDEPGGMARSPVSPPQFANVSATFVGRTYVRLQPSGDVDYIVYTLDGTDPSLTSPRYSKPVLVAETTVVKARAVGGRNRPGLSDTVSRRFRRLKVRPACDVRVNFQPPDAPLPVGYLVDSGKPFHVLKGGTGYGWNRDNSDAVRERGKHPDPLRDTLIFFSDGAYWEIGLTRGAYMVTILVGDSAQPCEDQTILAEGQAICTGLDLKAGAFKLVQARVDVDDGLLTLSSGADAHGTARTRMNWLDIRPAGGAE